MRSLFTKITKITGKVTKKSSTLRLPDSSNEKESDQGLKLVYEGAKPAIEYSSVNGQLKNRLTRSAASWLSTAMADIGNARGRIGTRDYFGSPMSFL
jgi:hypothetical protein